jgi:hypothetical protein
MTDFIDVLEAQLVAAHRRPERRRFVVVPWRATIVFAATVAAAAIVLVAVLALSSPAPRPAASPPTQPPQTTPVTPPAPVTIAVLNGTTLTGLARAVADELTSVGYDEPIVVTNDVSDQSRARTTIYYERDHRADALGIAACLHLDSDRVVPTNANARALADRADVAVFVGADRAR